MRGGRQLAERLKMLGKSTYIYEGAVTRGVIVDDRNRALFVDSGLEPRNGRQLVREALEHHWQPFGILTTHAHADHFGGHRAIVEACDCCVYASRLARPILECPLWEPIMMHSTASPPAALRDKFFVADPVSVDAAVGEGEALPPSLHDWPIQVFDLPGHSHGQVGFGAEDVLFCGDAFLQPRLLEKHGLPALVDVKATLDSLARLEDLVGDFEWLVISHGGAYRSEPARQHINTNRTFINQALEQTLCCLSRPMLIDELVRELARVQKRTLPRYGDLALYRMTVSAFLTYLESEGHVTTRLTDFVNTWCRV